MNTAFLPSLPLTLSYPLLFGALLVIGMLGGETARLFKLPRIIGYVLVGFAVAPIVRSGELGHSKRDVLHRLDRLCSELGLDRERARGWTIVQTVAWAEEAAQRLDEVVEWLR